MRAKAKVVIEHSGGSVIGLTVFTGKRMAGESRKHFLNLVLEDMESQAKATWLDDEFNRKAASREARGLKGNYTSESGDVDIVVMDAD